MKKNIRVFIALFILTLFVEYIDIVFLKDILNKILDEQFGIYTIGVITLLALLPATIFSFTKCSKINGFFQTVFNWLEPLYIAYISITLARLIYNHQYDDITFSTVRFQPFLLLIVAFVLQKLIYCKDKFFHYLAAFLILVFYVPMLFLILYLAIR